MRGFLVSDLLVGTNYRSPNSYKEGEINLVIGKRDDVWVGDDYKAFAVRYKPERGINYAWATIAVKVAD